jgi:lambda family phage portal protein
MGDMQHVDLGALPLKPSRILTQFAADRERQRREQQAQRERMAELAQWRAFGRARPARAAGRHALSMPQPAFAVVSGIPAAGAQREQRAFAAGGYDRLTAGWTGAGSSINADLEGALPTLRARSRDWVQNTDVGERFVELVCDNVVGTDVPRLQVRVQFGSGRSDERLNQAVERAWQRWCERGACDVTGTLSFYELCRQALAAAARDGEMLLRRVRSASLPWGYALQLLDVDRIDHTLNRAPAGGNAVRMGVEIDALGRPLALWLHGRHPSDSGALAPRALSERVPMQQLIHEFVRKRPEQLRGYPWAAAVLKRAATLASYEEYALVAAKIGAAKMGFYTVDKDAVDPDDLSWGAVKDATGQLVQDVEAGLLEALPPGVDFKSFDPEYPHANFGAFVTQCLRGIAAGLNVAHHNLSGDMSGVNYSSARIAELAERRHWRALQRWFLDAFVRPVFRDWLAVALLGGRVRYANGTPVAPDRFDDIADSAVFQPQGWAWVDPQADIEAAIAAAGSDMRSLRQICDEQGVDMDDVLMDNRRLLDRYRELGLAPPAWLARQAPQAADAAATTEDQTA